MSNRRRRPSVTLTPILPLSELKTCEGSEAQQELTKLHEADRYAASIVTGGVLISGDHENVRLAEAVHDLSGLIRGGTMSLYCL